MIDQAELKQVGSPGWWLRKLEKELDQQAREIATYEAYYDGKHKLQFATRKFRDAFGALFAAFADNWCEIVVDSSVERLTVEGFRFGQDQKADEDAWSIWQANQLDAESVSAQEEAVKCGKSYLLVAPDPSGGDMPLITAEHASQVVVSHAPGNRRLRQAALKRWVDDYGYANATLYLPDFLHKFRSQSPLKNGRSGRIDWIRRPGEELPVPNPLEAVPMVPLANKPPLLGTGESDLKKVIPLQDAVNKLVTDMIVASEFAAFRQRWATGIEIPEDPDTGRPMDPQKFLSSVARMWSVADENAKFGEFNVTDLSNYTKAIEMLVQHVAAQTRTPPHYLLGQSGAFPSGESLKATETGLVAKVLRKQINFGEGYEETMRLSFKARGDDTRAKATDMETIWRDPESRSFGELIDGLTKLQTLGVPNEILWEKAGFSPQMINRIKSMELADELLSGLDNTDPGATTAPVSPPAPAPA